MFKMAMKKFLPCLGYTVKITCLLIEVSQEFLSLDSFVGALAPCQQHKDLANWVMKKI